MKLLSFLRPQTFALGKQKSSSLLCNLTIRGVRGSTRSVPDWTSSITEGGDEEKNCLK
jgi:hypothetical protein